MSMLNARAITSPTAMTITSPRIRKFLKPLIVMSPLRAAVIQVWFGAWTFFPYLGYLPPLLSVASNHVNDRHQPGSLWSQRHRDQLHVDRLPVLRRAFEH